jgi:protein-S-isoprenylcysteine O-methyltransferase Ste14
MSEKRRLLPAAGASKRAGTPMVLFERSTRLMFDGWYRFTRNPMYPGLAPRVRRWI